MLSDCVTENGVNTEHKCSVKINTYIGILEFFLLSFYKTNWEKIVRLITLLIAPLTVSVRSNKKQVQQIRRQKYN